MLKAGGKPWLEGRGMATIAVSPLSKRLEQKHIAAKAEGFTLFDALGKRQVIWQPVAQLVQVVWGRPPDVRMPLWMRGSLGNQPCVGAVSIKCLGHGVLYACQ